jgi:uncharacterized membrane protein YcaP (DUF421 family)
MEPVIRALAIYVFLVVLFRVAGRRTLAQMTNFDFILLLIISEAAQNAMIGNDFSITNGMLVIATLIALDIFLSVYKHRRPWIECWLDGVPTVLVDHGRPLMNRLNETRVDEDDILTAARHSGLERMDQIKYAVLEVSGGISIIPKAEAK